MAIQKLITLPSGASGNYLYIRNISINPQDQSARIIMLLFKDNTFQPPNNHYLNVYEIELTPAHLVECVNIAPIITEGMTNFQIMAQLLANTYIWIVANVPEFSGGSIVA